MILGWILLTVAIITEVAGTLAIGLSQGFVKRPITALLVTIPGYSVSIICLTFIMRWQLMSVSVSYALWVALGIGLTVIASAFMGEPMTPLKIFFIIVLTAGAIGLNFADVH